MFRLINPMSHATSPEAVETYKVEPYVMAADVYAAPATRGGAVGLGIPAAAVGCTN